MVNLVSILAEDLQFVKSQLNTNVSKIQTINKVNSDLISVSDVENNDDDDAEGIEDSDDDVDDYNDDNDNDNDNDNDEDDDDEDNENNTYIIHEEELKKYPFKNVSLTNETSIKDFEELTNNLEIKTIHLENPISFEENDISSSNDKLNDLKVNDISFLKNVTMSDFENTENVEDLQGSYKKMSINKLREVIVSKGVVSDASKLKKNEILKMLEIDN
jgi:hypothetical protein